MEFEKFKLWEIVLDRLFFHPISNINRLTDSINDDPRFISSEFEMEVTLKEVTSCLTGLIKSNLVYVTRVGNRLFYSVDAAGVRKVFNRYFKKEWLTADLAYLVGFSYGTEEVDERPFREQVVSLTVAGQPVSVEMLSDALLDAGASDEAINLCKGNCEAFAWAVKDMLKGSE